MPENYPYTNPYEHMNESQYNASQVQTKQETAFQSDPFKLAEYEGELHEPQQFGSEYGHQAMQPTQVESSAMPHSVELSPQSLTSAGVVPQVETAPQKETIKQKLSNFAGKLCVKKQTEADPINGLSDTSQVESIAGPKQQVMPTWMKQPLPYDPSQYNFKSAQKKYDGMPSGIKKQMYGGITNAHTQPNSGIINVPNPFKANNLHDPFDFTGNGVDIAEAARIPERIKSKGTFFKEAPKFTNQLEDDSRTSPITYVSNMRTAMGTETNIGDHVDVSEMTSIRMLSSFLEEVETSHVSPAEQLRAKSMRENLTFIGEKEYIEATSAIANKWRSELAANPDKQICVITNRITEGMPKSDAYLFDNILRHLSDDEIQTYGDRIHTDPGDVTASGKNVDIVLLDDWTISGSQMRGVARKIAADHPEFTDRMSVMLIAASEKRLNEGIELDIANWNVSKPAGSIPVHAYYKANSASGDVRTSSSAHITGSHCAVDFDFNNDVAYMSQLIGKDMPPATNIVRPYRKPGYAFKNTQRLIARKLNGAMK